MKTIQLYDTTLRDGTQREGISLSVEDKIKIAQRLDQFGVHYIEGGWPGSNPKDAAFFERVQKMNFKTAKITAFGSTTKKDTPPEEDKNIQALEAANTPVVTIVGKTWDLHVTEVLETSLDNNLTMIADSIAYFKSRGKEVIYDAEHFFDGYRANPDYAISTLQSAANAGADMVVLCDTNGGTLPWEIEEYFRDIADLVKVPLGIHAHNDSGVGVANTLAAVRAGAVQIQGTVNGYGERVGNANLCTIIPDLQLKMGYSCVPNENLECLSELSYYVSEVANLPHDRHAPFVGESAFAHKGGIHVSAISKNPIAYEHVSPEKVGNRRRVIVSDLSGKSNIEYKARELGIETGGNGFDSRKIVDEIKRLEALGYQFDAAEGSLELLIKKVTGQFEDPFNR